MQTTEPWTPTSHLQGWVQHNLDRVAEIHRMVHQKNLSLSSALSKSCVRSFFIDPAPFTRFFHQGEQKPREFVDSLAEKFANVYLITEQSDLSVPENVSVCVVPNDFYGLYYYETELAVDTPILQQYNCFINRLDVLRQKFFYLLYINNLLDYGYVSFRLKRSPGCYYPGLTDKDTFDHYHRQWLSAFDDIKPELDRLVPYINFDNTRDLFDLTLQSKFSIVIEAHPERTEAKVMSEKIFRALQTPRPWLLFAASGCVAKLRNLGFDVFDDLVDHSYDALDTTHNANPMINSIVEEAKRLCEISVTPALLKRFDEAYQHNRKIMYSWHQSWRTSCRNFVDDVFAKAVARETA